MASQHTPHIHCRWSPYRGNSRLRGTALFSAPKIMRQRDTVKMEEHHICTWSRRGRRIGSPPRKPPAAAGTTTTSRIRKRGSGRERSFRAGLSRSQGVTLGKKPSAASTCENRSVYTTHRCAGVASATPERAIARSKVTRRPPRFTASASKYRSVSWRAPRMRSA
jgi:hypothetical protein